MQRFKNYLVLFYQSIENEHQFNKSNCYLNFNSVSTGKWSDG